MKVPFLGDQGPAREFYIVPKNLSLKAYDLILKNLFGVDGPLIGFKYGSFKNYLNKESDYVTFNFFDYSKKINYKGEAEDKPYYFMFDSSLFDFYSPKSTSFYKKITDFKDFPNVTEAYAKLTNKPQGFYNWSYDPPNDQYRGVREVQPSTQVGQGKKLKKYRKSRKSKKSRKSRNSRKSKK
jgi:hypothetical protein